eukprot:269524_1
MVTHLNGCLLKQTIVHLVIITLQLLCTSDNITYFKSSFTFGIKTSANTDAFSTDPIKLTLYWGMFLKYQCVITPTQTNKLYLCNTSNNITTHKCDINSSSQSNTYTNQIQYGIQIDNIESDSVGIDSVIIQHKQQNNNIIKQYRIEYFCFTTETDKYCYNSLHVGYDTIYVAKPYTFLIFNVSNNSSESDVVNVSESSQCITVHWKDKLLQPICVFGSKHPYLNALYQYIYWNITVDAPVYYSALNRRYIFPMTIRFLGHAAYYWKIGFDPQRSVSDLYCSTLFFTRSFHKSQLINCTQWRMGISPRTPDTNLIIKQCDETMQSSIDFGFKTGSYTSDGLIKLSLFWNETRYQCTVIPKNKTEWYTCNTIKSSECGTVSTENDVKYGLQIDKLNTDKLSVSTMVIKTFMGNVLINTYFISQFCMHSNLLSTSYHCLEDVKYALVIENKYPYNLIVFDYADTSHSFGLTSYIYPQNTSTQCFRSNYTDYPTDNPVSNPTEKLINVTIFDDKSRRNDDKFEIISICIGTAVILLIIVVIILCVWVKRKGEKYSAIKTVESVESDNDEYIRNALVVIIAIGCYEPNNNSDLQNICLKQLPLKNDIDNLNELFDDLLNYKVIPTEFKMSWTEHELITFLKEDVCQQLFDNNMDNELQYDGLIVCISCHGMKHTIITSDYKIIEKTVIHRIISKHPQA